MHIRLANSTTLHVVQHYYVVANLYLLAGHMHPPVETLLVEAQTLPGRWLIADDNLVAVVLGRHPQFFHAHD